MSELKHLLLWKSSLCCCLWFFSKYSFSFRSFLLVQHKFSGKLIVGTKYALTPNQFTLTPNQWPLISTEYVQQIWNDNYL